MKKQILVVTILSVLLCTFVTSQESIVFDKRYFFDNGGILTCGKQTNDAGYVAVGYYSQSMVDDSYLIMKTDSVGNMEWYNYFGMQGSRLWGVDITIDGYYIAAGANMDNPEWKERAVLIKYNQSGDTIWKKEYLSPNIPGDTAFSQTHFYDLVCTNDTAIVAVGGCFYTDGLYLDSGTDPFIVKTDYNGDTLWTWRAYIYDQLHPEYGNTVYFSAVAETNEGDYIAVGYSDYPIGMKTFYGPNGGIMAKFSKNGELIFFKDFHDVSHTIFSDVEVDSQGNIIVFGDKINYEDEDSLGIENGLVVKFDTDGNVLFYRLISSIKSVVGRAGCITKNDEILFIGSLIPPDELDWWEDTWLIKYTGDGEKLWEKIIGGKVSLNLHHKVVLTIDNGLVLFGGYGELNQNLYGWIVKTDSLGNGVYELGWQNSINQIQFINEVNVFPNPASNYVTIE
ncbi:MAG: hypothetical protein PHE56_13545, partial [Bacteroidales bacterium]|nr:hypothetical protein [Bacteroidales bacterium]